ncbi:MAG: FAD binding domain-containing protein [Phycisphaerae bacterium]
MNSFAFVTVTREGEAIEARTHNGEAAFIAGGTTLIDLMKLGVEQPPKLVDINRVPLGKIEEAGGGVRVGAMVRNSDMAYHPLIRERYPVLSEALLSGASAQLRNMATTGGNLMQRTRCTYFRDVSYPCNKRQPGSGCSAIDGFNRMHAVLGTSDKCIATHPSDMTVALVALEATIVVRGKGGERRIPIEQFYVAYGEDPAKETVLAPGELITAVELPAIAYARRSKYLKVRDRASYEFALASAAVAMDVQGGTIREARVGLGGIATKPWRSHEAEQALNGKPASDETFRAAADAALRDAKTYHYNAFKPELARRTLVRTLQTVAGMA